MNIFSWNVNGIRAVKKKGFFDFLSEYDPDILCLQETKAHVEQLGDDLINIPGYKSFFDSPKYKKGYSGVAIYTKGTLEGISDSFTNQVVISPVVPMKFGKVVSYDPPESGSAAIEIQNVLPDTVNVVSAYHNIPAKGLANFEKPLDYDVVICGDNDDAKSLVTKLTEEMPNLKAIDAGPLEISAMIEAITPLIINMNKKHKHEFSIKFI